jgi:hypothetical protein
MPLVVLLMPPPPGVPMKRRARELAPQGAPACEV